jgi:ribulose kinase
MFSNYNIWKYCAKYFVLMTLGAYVFNTSVIFINQKSDVANLIGSALFAGLFVGTMLILKSDVTKLVKNINKTENKENE